MEAGLQGAGKPPPSFDPTARNFDGHLVRPEEKPNHIPPSPLSSYPTVCMRAERPSRIPPLKDIEMYFDDSEDDDPGTTAAAAAQQQAHGWGAVRRAAADTTGGHGGISLIGRPTGTFTSTDPAWMRQLKLELRGLIVAARDMLTLKDMEGGWWLWKGMELQPMIAEIAKARGKYHVPIISHTTDRKNIKCFHGPLFGYPSQVKELLKTDGLDHALQSRLAELLRAVRDYQRTAARILAVRGYTRIRGCAYLPRFLRGFVPRFDADAHACVSGVCALLPLSGGGPLCWFLLCFTRRIRVAAADGVYPCIRIEHLPLYPQDLGAKETNQRSKEGFKAAAEAILGARKRTSFPSLSAPVFPPRLAPHAPLSRLRPRGRAAPPCAPLRRCCDALLRLSSSLLSFDSPRPDFFSSPLLFPQASGSRASLTAGC